MVGDPADAGAGDGGAEDVAEEAREASGGAGGVFGDEVEGVEADEHDWAVDEEADGDEGGDVDPERAVLVEGVDDEGGEGEGGEEDGGWGAAAVEEAVGEEAAEDSAGDACGFEGEPCETGLTEVEAFGGLEVGGDPVDDPVADEVDEGVGEGDGPEGSVRENVVEEDFAEREDAFLGMGVVWREVVAEFLDGREPAGLGGVAEEEDDEDGADGGDGGWEVEFGVP